MWVPIVKQLVQTYTNVEVTFITKNITATFFKNIPNVHVVTIDTANKHKGIFGLIKFITAFNKSNSIDYFIDGHDVLRSKIIKRFINSKNKITFYKPRKERIAFIKTKNVPLPHITTNYIEALATIGFPVSFNNLVASTFSTTVSNIIGIAPFAKHTGKIYPTHLMQQVIDYFSTKGVKIYLFGANNGKELEQMVLWQQNYSNIILTNTLSFDAQINIIKTLPVMVTMDSANMHIAAIHNIPTVSIWGATSPTLGFGPINNNHKIIEYSLPCKPCAVFGNKPCMLSTNKYACLNNIHPISIIDAVEKYLA